MLKYKLSWKLYFLGAKVRRFKFKLKHDTCWHFSKWSWKYGPRCVICWMKHEMFTMLREEENKQILWGDGK